MTMGCNLIVVDLREVIEEYGSYTAMYDLYRHYPLKNMVTALLTGEINYQEVVWFDLEKNINDNNILDSLDFDSIDLFFNDLTMDLDNYISRKIGAPFEHVDCYFSSWLDNTSVVLAER
jgi:hypothetical protein